MLAPVGLGVSLFSYLGLWRYSSAVANVRNKYLEGEPMPSFEEYKAAKNK